MKMISAGIHFSSAQIQFFSKSGGQSFVGFIAIAIQVWSAFFYFVFAENWSIDSTNFFKI